MATTTTDAGLAARLEEIKALLASQSTTQQQAATQAPQPFNLKLGGNDYTVRDGVEAQRLIEQYESQQREEHERLRLEVEAQQQRHEAALPTVPTAVADGFSKEKWAELVLKDPREANRYVWQNDPGIQGLFGKLTAELSQVKQEAAAQAFLNQHREDYQPSAGNYKAIESIIQSHNLPWDLNGLNLALVVGRSTGQITDTRQQQQGGGDQDQQVDPDNLIEFQPQQRQRQAAPPRIQRRGNTEADSNDAVMAEFEKLSPDQMKSQILKWSGGR